MGKVHISCSFAVISIMFFMGIAPRFCYLNGSDTLFIHLHILQSILSYYCQLNLAEVSSDIQFKNNPTVPNVVNENSYIVGISTEPRYNAQLVEHLSAHLLPGVVCACLPGFFTFTSTDKSRLSTGLELCGKIEQMLESFRDWNRRSFATDLVKGRRILQSIQ